MKKAASMTSIMAPDSCSKKDLAWCVCSLSSRDSEVLTALIGLFSGLEDTRELDTQCNVLKPTTNLVTIQLNRHNNIYL